MSTSSLLRCHQLKSGIIKSVKQNYLNAQKHTRKSYLDYVICKYIISFFFDIILIFYLFLYRWRYKRARPSYLNIIKTRTAYKNFRMFKNLKYLPDSVNPVARRPRLKFYKDIQTVRVYTKKQWLDIPAIHSVLTDLCKGNIYIAYYIVNMNKRKHLY